MTLKRAVAVSLIAFGIIIALVLIGGLIVPSSVLLKYSKDKNSDPSALLTDDSSGEVDSSSEIGEQDEAEDTNEVSNTTQNQATSPEAAANPSAATPSGTSTTTGTGGGSTPSSGVAPSLVLAVSPTTITSGSTAVLSWSITAGATQPVTCTASNGWSGAKATSGSENKSPTSSTTYTLTCSNSAGQSSKSASVTVNSAPPPPPGCGSGGTCTLSNVQAHATQADCWMIVAYSGGGGNGTGKVYKVASSFFGGSGAHGGLPSAPSLSASQWCGKNISTTFNGKHGGGTRSDGAHNAIWWLTNNGNSYIGDWTGN